MRSWVLAFCFGNSLILSLSNLPSENCLKVIIFLNITTWLLCPSKYKKIIRLPIAVIFGFAWVTSHAISFANIKLPTQFEGQTLKAQGTIVSIPEKHNKSSEFEFAISQVILNNTTYQLPIKVRLGWYNQAPELKVGDSWELVVRLKKPRGFWDEGSFDYQKWLFEHHISATGYVTASDDNHRLKKNSYWQIVDRMRQNISQNVTQSLANKPLKGLINALTVGVRDQITDEQWQIMRGTGTNHLFAIAGLHIGFVSGMVFAMVNFLWRRVRNLSLLIPTPQIAAFASLLAAVIYSALAGFALPTQRAVIMTSVFLISMLMRKHLPAWSAWCLALLLVLLWEPLSVLSDSFWLSFGAVAYIIYGVSARLGKSNFLAEWNRAQWVVAVGLVPMSLLFFHEASLAGFIANAIAIPWVGFVVLPLSLLGSFIGPLLPKLGSLLLIAAENLLALVWSLLGFIAHLSWAQWNSYISQSWIIATSSLGVALLLAPSGWPARWLGIIWLLPLVACKSLKPSLGEIWFSLLDVGQGLATVVRTQHHVLIYDTGPKFNPNFDTGSAVVIPYLHYLGIKQIDLLMISHPDNDHIGGADSLLKTISTSTVLTSVPEKIHTNSANLCVAGQNWKWDGVDFTVIYPPKGLDNLDNDSSCVLKISNGTYSILLSGDIEKASENYLLANNLLSPTTIVIAPHHGSLTSSTMNFLTVTRPQYALFPVGYLNRYHFPNPIIVERYKNIGAKIYSTAIEGSISFKLPQQKQLEIQTYQQKHHRFWQ